MKTALEPGRTNAARASGDRGPRAGDRAALQRAAEHAAAARGLLAPSPPALLALQRAAGNSAVAGTVGPRVVQRQQGGAPAQTPPGGAQPAPAPPARGTAAAFPSLDVRPSRHGTPCACVVFIHNDEQNARLTAELMHANCSYNLAIRSPATGGRRVGLPRTSPRAPATRDPNELFPPAIAERCTDDPVACTDFLARNRGARDPATILQFVQTQFFMAIRECSAGFSLPVVALHNNILTDTEAYQRERTRTRGAADPELRVDIDKSHPQGMTVARLEALLRRRFGETTQENLTETGGTTNIFRWCALDDIARCHVGNPAQPDNVIWTTNPGDFERLSLTPVNVVLQAGARRGGESETDLSTLFLTMGGIIDRRVIEGIVNDLEVEVADLLRALTQLNQASGPAATREVFDHVAALIRHMLRYAVTTGVQAVRPTRPRFVNIETPGTALGDRTDDQRVESFRFILSALRTVGLACCSPPGGGGEAAIEAGLRVAPPRRP